MEIVIPREVQNRITTQARMYWVSNFAGLISSADYKKNIIELYEKKEGEKYFALERANERYNAVMRENERLLTKIRNLQAPKI